MDQPLPLFLQYPGLLTLPYVSLGLFPTPVQPLFGLAGNKNRVFIKRDDLSGAEYGGNKVRKLEFALGEAKSEGATDVLTYGCDGSNHALATGIYARQLGMHSISILRSQPNTQYLRQNLLKSLYYGIEIHHYKDKGELDKGAALVMEERKSATGRYPYVIPVGGSSSLGTVGFINAAFELARQVEQGQLPEPDYIYVADGTNGTAAGLIIGLRALGLKTKVVAVQVNDDARVNIPAILELIEDTISVVRQVDPSFPDLHFTKSDILLEQDFFGGEYARYSLEGVAAMKLINLKFGIELEGTYTGKALAALLHNAEHVHCAKNIVFWNTLNSRPAPINVDALVNYQDLPENLHYYFQTDVQPLDR